MHTYSIEHSSIWVVCLELLSIRVVVLCFSYSYVCLTPLVSSTLALSEDKRPGSEAMLSCFCIQLTCRPIGKRVYVQVRPRGKPRLCTS